MRYRVNSVSNSRRASCNPSSVKATDFALPTGSVMKPFSWSLPTLASHGVPVEALPRRIAFVEPQVQECKALSHQPVVY